MKKLIKVQWLIFLMISSICCNENAERINEQRSEPTLASSGLAPRENFNDTLNGNKVSLFYLKNKDIQASITNYGGRVVNLIVPDKSGKMTDVAVGFDSFKGFYNSKEPYFGALIGRYGNRIAKGKFSLDGMQYTTPLNNGVNTLHGGPGGFHNVVWDARQQNDSTLELTYLSKDGEMGFPGNLLVKVIYTLTAERAMKIEYEAKTDKKTVCNLTNHTFFNLNGSGTINGHFLMIDADKYLPVDSTLIPVGNQDNIAGTAFDFRKSTAIGDRINDHNQQLSFGKGYDHNFVLNKKSGTLPMVAEVSGDKSGIILQLYTIEPGLQFYSGNFMQSKNILKAGVRDSFRTAFCLEPQHFPDSPNEPLFPSTILEVGKIFRSVSLYQFR